MLKYALKECKNHVLNKVIVGCYKENIGSAKAIIKNNGKLIKEKKLKNKVKIFALFFICTILLITNLLHFYELYHFVKNQIYPLLKHI